MDLLIQKNIRIDSLTTFRIGGPAKYFFEAQNRRELNEAINWAQERNIQYFVLGGGSNILASDHGFNGLLIKVPAEEIKTKEGPEGFEIVEVGAGLLLSNLISFCLKQKLSGLEYFIGIPGTVGGAIYGNAGWPRGQKNIGDFMIDATLLMPNGQISKKKADWFDFAYRTSKLKNFDSQKIIILSASFKLKLEDPNKILETQKEIFGIRQKGIPQGYSAGCIFKNIEIQKSEPSYLPSLLGQLPPVFIEKGSIPAGWLIDQCGLKGHKIGGAQISDQHANFIINANKAKSQDVHSLIEIVRKEVKKKFSINLSLEIEYLL